MSFKYQLLLIAILFALSSCSKETDDVLETVEENVIPTKPSDGNNGKGDDTGSGTGTGNGTGTNTDSCTVSIINFLGDSIIDYWPNLSDYFPSFQCNNFGITRMGIKSFLKNVDKSKLVNSVCVIEIGTNDMKNVILADTIDNYVKVYIDVLSSLNAKQIYLFSLLPRNRAKDNFDFNKYYPSINSKIKEAVQKSMNNVIYVNVYDLFLKNGEINWDYTSDGLHPNAAGYKVMADELKKYLNTTES